MACIAGLSFIGVVAAVVLAATGCGGSTTTSDSPSTSPSTSAAPAAPSAPAHATTPPPRAEGAANTPPDSEIESALSAAGVSNAARWAHEVVEYRPHPADDPNLTKLR